MSLRSTAGDKELREIVKRQGQRIQGLQKELKELRDFVNPPPPSPLSPRRKHKVKEDKNESQ